MSLDRTIKKMDDPPKQHPARSRRPDRCTVELFGAYFSTLRTEDKYFQDILVTLARYRQKYSQINFFRIYRS